MNIHNLTFIKTNVRKTVQIKKGINKNPLDRQMNNIPPGSE